MTPDDLAASMVPVACDLACMIRDGDRRAIGRCLDSLLRESPEDWPQKLYALITVMAAMIPDDAPQGDLLAWLEPGTPQREAMLSRAHGRATKRQRKGLPLWGPLAAMELEYQQGLTARRAAAAEAERAA